MDGKVVINELRGILTKCRNQGRTEVPIDNLEVYISSVEQHATQCYDYQKMKNDSQLEMFRSVISSGANAIKAAMLINGGGAVALLAFAGKIQNTEIVADINYLAHALFYFCIGVLFSAIASGTTYATQRVYHHKGSTIHGHILTAITVIMVLASYCLFFLGVYYAAHALGMDKNIF